MRKVLFVILSMLFTTGSCIANETENHEVASNEDASISLTIKDVGIGIGNAPSIHGLRLAINDDNLNVVNGLDITLYKSSFRPGCCCS